MLKEQLELSNNEGCLYSSKSAVIMTQYYIALSGSLVCICTAQF